MHRDPFPPSVLLPLSAPATGEAWTQLLDVARAASRVWAWWPGDGAPLRVSGRPPRDGRVVDSAAVLIDLLRHTHPEACTPALCAPLRRALRPDGSVPAPVLLRVLQALQPPH